MATRVIMMTLATAAATMSTGCGPQGWENMSAPDIHGIAAMAAVESFVATNGWDMPMTPFDFAYGDQCARVKRITLAQT